MRGKQGTNHSSSCGTRRILTWVNPRHELFKSIKPLRCDKKVAIKAERAVVLLHRFLVLVRRYVRVRQCCMQVLVTLLLQPFLQSCVCHRCEQGWWKELQTDGTQYVSARESGRQRRDTITSNRTESRPIERERSGDIDRNRNRDRKVFTTHSLIASSLALVNSYNLARASTVPTARRSKDRAFKNDRFAFSV